MSELEKIMRHPLLPIGRVLLVASLSLLISCIQKDDTGKACELVLKVSPLEPIVGEAPVQEVVRLERNSRCLSFHCLEHRGLPPYCTKECSQKSPEGSSNCSSHGDCASPLYCSNGKCVQDSCAPGYWCQEIQATGPLAGQSFCIRRDTCVLNSDCGALGSVDCIPYGCFDECLLNPDCEFHRYLCLPKDELPCACREDSVDDAGACSNIDFVCQSNAEEPAWPEESVSQQGICTSKEE